MSTRPKAAEIEEDLLKLQREFLNSKKTPSSAVVRTSNATENEVQEERTKAYNLLKKGKSTINSTLNAYCFQC